MQRKFHHGDEDGFEPLASLDLDKIKDFPGLLQQMSKTAFGGRELGEAYHVLLEMAGDSACKIVLTVSGAMTIGKMGTIICDMISHGLADMVITTGAIMAHGLTESIGCTHYKYNPELDDRKLYQWGYNRVYDTLEKEESLAEAEHVVSEVLDAFDLKRPTCSYEITRATGKYLFEKGMMPSILGAAFQHEVPVYIPAFTDSEYGLNVSTHLMAKTKVNNPGVALEDLLAEAPGFNPFLDLYDYSRRITEADRIGIVTIGGGVPRNWGQQIGPFVDIINYRLGCDFPVPRFHYGVRICPEPVHWGGLSGCTYSEGVSWGKFVSSAEGGRFAEVHCDATIAWPILIKAVLESL